MPQVEAVMRRILFILREASAKVLVFSTWVDVLDIMVSLRAIIALWNCFDMAQCSLIVSPYVKLSTLTLRGRLKCLSVIMSAQAHALGVNGVRFAYPRGQAKFSRELAAFRSAAGVQQSRSASIAAGATR